MLLEAVASVLFGLYVHLNYLASSLIMALPYSRHRKLEKQPKKWPKVSVIISSKNEESVIERTLKALKASGYPAMEIILADASTDGTRKIAKKYADKIVKDEGKGKPEAANKAAKAARGDILYFLDADSEIRQGSIQKLVSMLDSAAAAVGVSVPRNKGTITARMARLQYAHFSGMQRVGMRAAGSPVITGKNFAIWKTAFGEVGCFDNVLTEDINLTSKLRKAKKRIEFNPDALVEEHVPEVLGHYLRQQERWYCGALSEIRKSATGTRKRQLFTTLPLAILTMFSPAFVFLFGIAGLLAGNLYLLSAAALGYLMKIVAAARYLEAGDIIFSPISYPLLCATQFGMLCYCGLKKLFGMNTEWYRTPKTA